MRHGSTGSLFHTEALAVRYRTKLLRPSLVSGSISLGTSNRHHCPALHPVSAGLLFAKPLACLRTAVPRFRLSARAKRKRVCRGFLSGRRSSSVPIRRLAGLVAVRVIGVPTAAADSIMRRSRVARQRYLLSGAKGKAPRTRPHRSASEGLVARLALGSTTATGGDDHRGGLKDRKSKPLPR